jgi:hypothetical protein
MRAGSVVMRSKFVTVWFSLLRFYQCGELKAKAGCRQRRFSVLRNSVALRQGKLAPPREGLAEIFAFQE